MPTTPPLTAEQAAALNTSDTSIALAAGAGCGKTFVLSKRFLSHLDHDNPLIHQAAELHQLVAITFTDAAAREMRRRIRNTCYERSQSALAKESQDAWLKLLRAIEAARVSTIHAFCASLLREHAVAAGLDPTFGVLEQGAADVLESEVIDDVLRTQLADLEPTTMNLAASSGLAKLKTQLRDLLKYRHDPNFHRWRSATPADIVAAWQSCYEQDAVPAALAELAASPDLPLILELLHTVAPSASKPKFVAAKAQLLDMLPRLAQAELVDNELQSLRSCTGVSGICSEKDWPDSASYNTYRDACKRFRTAIDKHTPKPFSPIAAHAAAERSLELLELAHHVAQEYERAKARAGKLDFDDLLVCAYQLLSDPVHAPLRQRLSSNLRLLLVDEFQDTDRLQVELVKLLCGDIAAGKLFFVGDMNQSIYRFRGAQPDVFRELRAQIPESGQLPLTKNFRSQPAVLDFVNALFVQTLGDDYQPLRPHRLQITPQPAIEFLWTLTPDKTGRQVKGAARDAREQEARRIARRIRQLLESAAPIIADDKATDGRRPLQLGDVAILFRALSDVALYEAALREYGLDYYLVGGHAFYAQQEIFDVLNLLRSVVSPADEISLAGVLRSPFFSLEDETLFWLVDSAGSLNDGLFSETLPKQLSNTERLKAATAANTIAYLRTHKDSLPITTLLHKALARTGYDATLLAEFLGERKLANLNKLIEQARAADSGDVLDLAGFIAQLAEFVAREPKEALAATLSESADVIRLMTIHQAKGLEFPLVVVADIDRKPDFRVPSAALHETLGPIVKPPADDDEEPTATGIDLYNTLEKLADVEERKRLFYVAATRAADYLMLSSSLVGYETDKLDSDWTKLLAKRFDLATGEFHGTLPAGYAVPQVRVTDSEPATAFKPLGHEHGADLVTIVEQARDLAASGGGTIPPDIGPFAPDLTARRQFSVSRLSGKLVRPDFDEFQPQPPKPDAIDPLALGTFVHAVLARFDLTGTTPIAALCEQLAAERVVPLDERAVEIAVKMLERFVDSARWSQIAAANTVQRELEFLLAWPSASGPDHHLYVQGFFDCIYQDSSGWHLVDYKTNDTTPTEAESLAKKYEMQMLLYALAIERAFGQPPVEVVLHFLRPGVEIIFDWNDHSRQRCLQLVSEALLEPS